jgi:hypothetical protein
MIETTNPETAAPSPTVESNGRDQRGRFTAGNGGGPGNPFARQMAACRKALLSAVTTEELTALMRVLLDKAMQGDMAAAKLVLAYAVGKPAEQTDPDRLDVGEWKQFKESATMVEELPKVVQTPEPELPLQVMRATRPGVTLGWARRLADTLRLPTTETQRKEKRPETVRPRVPTATAAGNGKAHGLSYPIEPYGDGRGGAKPG